jgi:hypothetical protein
MIGLMQRLEQSISTASAPSCFFLLDWLVGSHLWAQRHDRSHCHSSIHIRVAMSPIYRQKNYASLLLPMLKHQMAQAPEYDSPPLLHYPEDAVCQDR